MMVESEALELPEDVMLGGVVFGHEQMQAAIQAIHELAEEAGKPAWDWKPPAKDEALIARVKRAGRAGPARGLPHQAEEGALGSASTRSGSASSRRSASASEGGPTRNAVKDICFNLESKIVRSQILDGEPRIDGRDTRTVRPITVRVGVLPRTHGSALFTRGETQALVTVTLGTGRDEQIIDALAGEYRERFMFHYNMPPYATGETGRFGFAKRREIGHGRLAKRALVGLLPTQEDFGYSLRVVSEITESNGSSSMASVCGGSLALMDAGVPIKAHVAGIAMGLIKEGNRFAVLSDILGDEDHLGDMDFKVAGTEQGHHRAADGPEDRVDQQGHHEGRARPGARGAHRASCEIMKRRHRGLARPSSPASRRASSRSRSTRTRSATSSARAAWSSAASRKRPAPPSRSRTTAPSPSPASSAEGGEAAKKRIQDLTADVEVGKIYEGPVLRLLDFGAIVQLLPGRDGLLHISQISQRARQRRLRPPEGRPDREGEGARGRRQGPRAPVDEGGRVAGQTAKRS